MVILTQRCIDNVKYINSIDDSKTEVHKVLEELLNKLTLNYHELYLVSYSDNDSIKIETMVVLVVSTTL